MSSEELERFTAVYLSYVLYALLLLQLRSSVSLLLLVLSAGRRRRSALLHCALCASSASSVLLRSLPSARRRGSRSCWMRVRSKDWWERVVLTEFTDAQWRQSFRMGRGSFDKLCGLMEQVLSPRDVTVRAPIPLQMRAAIALYKLASCAEYRTVANQFGVHKSTVKKFVYTFCKGMSSSVIGGLIQVPTAEQARSISQRFQRSFSIPQVLGCIHHTHIPVLPPSDGHGDFINSRGWPSYVLQAVVDDMHRFWSIDCKTPGCAKEVDVLRQSALFSHAHLLPKEPREISGTSVNLFLLGDAAHPLTDWLIKGFAHSPRITPEQESFNLHLNAARTTAEVAFARLKSRWRVLLGRSDFHYTFTPHVIATCCALHNFCERENEDVDPAWTEEAAALERALPQPGVRPYNTSECPEGLRIRDALAECVKAGLPLSTPPQ